MATNRLARTLSAFSPSTRRWSPLPVLSRNPANFPARVTQGHAQPQTLSLVSWNIDAFSPRPLARAKLILEHVLEGQNAPDVTLLQEVSKDVCVSLLNDARVRKAFIATDAEDHASFENVPFATMMLLSRARFALGLESPEEDEDGGGRRLTLGRVRVALPSKYGRDGLCVDVHVYHPSAHDTDTVFRFVNVHLDSLWDTFHYRAQQLAILSGILREPGCVGGIIAGDFNAISPQDDGLVDKNNLVDAWVALHPKDDAEPTWNNGLARRGSLPARRLDKVVMAGAKPEEIHILRPGVIEIPKPGVESVYIPWSDHCGLRCTFTI